MAAQRSRKSREEPVKGEVKLHGFVSRPEIQKLNRNSIFIFVNGRLIRDRLVQHALTEAYRNIIPPTVYPVVLLFLEMPATEVDVNVHPSKTEVRFRQSSVLHDFIRDSVRAALMKSRPVPAFMTEIHASPSASPSLTPGAHDFASSELHVTEADAAFALRPQELPPFTAPLQFEGGGFAVEANAAVPVARFGPQTFGGRGSDCRALRGRQRLLAGGRATTMRPRPGIAGDAEAGRPDSRVVHPRDQSAGPVDHRSARGARAHSVREDLQAAAGRVARAAANADAADRRADARPDGGLRRDFRRAESQRLRGRTLRLAHHRGEDNRRGHRGREVEHLLHEILEQFEREEQSLNLDRIRTNIAASIACHAAIKVNMPLEQNKMEWLLRELAKTDCPMSCPHGRPVVLRYSVKDIQRAFKRI